MWQIKKRLWLDLEDEAEDENERIQYLKFVDGMFSAQTGVVLSVLILSIAIIFQLSVPIIAIAIAAIIISNLVVTRLLKVNHDMNQDRDLPDINDPDYSRKLLQSSDEGEKYVILEGLYKTYSHTNLYLILAVVAATIYSLLSGTS